MSRKDEPKKKLRFRGDTNLLQQFDNRVEDILDETEKRNGKNGDMNNGNGKQKVKERRKFASLTDFLKMELTRGYLLEHDEERYTARREKIYSFMRIPREVEKFMCYGVLQCADSFLYIHTFLPIRFLFALWAIIYRPIAKCLGLRRRTQRILTPAEVCDLLKGSIWIACCLIILSIDTNKMYHIIKSQSIIKLYIFYNMLEVGDRLLSAFGQDSIDALFWTATEPKDRPKNHLGIIMHIGFAMFYVLFHSVLIMFQAITLNVAVNSNNKGLLTIMMSNNFVELKGSVFKKFDKNNLFQLSCSDVRERFHLSILMFIVVIQTMKEFNWKQEQFFVMLPDCLYVFFTEVGVDWIKHAFITRFNELPVEVFKEYRLSLAYDMTQTRQRHAFSDHSDLVARRMGFIPFPLSVVLIKALYHAISYENMAAIILFIVAFIILLTFRILTTIFALGKACDLMEQHASEKNCNNSSTTGGTTPQSKQRSMQTTDTATSPLHSFSRSHTVDGTHDIRTFTTSCNDTFIDDSANLGATALFSNSDVDLDDVCLNEQLLNINDCSSVFQDDSVMTRSVPDLQKERKKKISLDTSCNSETNLHVRSHRRSESEPSINNNILDTNDQ